MSTCDIQIIIVLGRGWLVQFEYSGDRAVPVVCQNWLVWSYSFLLHSPCGEVVISHCSENCSNLLEANAGPLFVCQKLHYQVFRSKGYL